MRRVGIRVWPDLGCGRWVVRMKRVAICVRVSTANKSRKGDTVAFNQDPAVQEGPLRQ